MLCLFVLGAVLVAADAASLPLPSYLKACSKSDPNFSACAVKNGQEALPYVIKGDKTYNIPPFNPLHIPKMEISPGRNLAINLADCEIYGLEGTILKDFKLNEAKKEIFLELFVPRINLQSKYDIKGRILILPIQGKGDANITYIDSTFKYTLYYNLVEKHGKEFIVMKDSRLDMMTKQSHFDLTNLFNGDKVLGEEMNRFMNENSEAVNMEFAPGIAETIKQIISVMMKGFLQKTSYDTLLLQ